MRQEFLNAIKFCRNQEKRFLHMLVFADWLEEQGDNEHLGWREIVHTRFAPSRGALWDIWRCSCVGLADDIPEEVWEILELPKEAFLFSVKNAPTKIAAYEAVAKAYAKIIKKVAI